MELKTGLPQGSVLGPFQYPAYTAPLFSIARRYAIEMHMYADDTQLYVSFEADQCDDAVRNMQLCLEEIQYWMRVNQLKLNTSKTEVLLLGSPHNLRKIRLSNVVIGGDEIDLTTSARNIGAVLDSNLDMSDHVNSVTRACYFHLRRISQIRPYLTQDAAATLVRSLITTRLDYVNGLLYGLPDRLLHKLQLIQNNAARMVMRKGKREHVTPLLKQLHWLPIKHRIEYKINLMTFKALKGDAPTYITELLEVYQPTRSLRSSSRGLLVEKRSSKKKTGDRAFSVCAPKLWNKLPTEVTNCTTIGTFKTKLKTHLFKAAFNSSD